jgi:hypothetical protein
LFEPTGQKKLDRIAARPYCNAIAVRSPGPLSQKFDESRADAASLVAGQNVEAV